MSCHEKQWAALVPELLGSILSRLFGKDATVFRAVCRGWKVVPPPLIDHVHPPVTDIVKYPFLLRYRTSHAPHEYPSSYSTCELYSPAYNKTYTLDVRVPGLDDAQIHSSNYGWLLLSTKNCVFFLQPSTGDVIELPRMGETHRPIFNGLSFSAPPTSPNCMVFGLVVGGNDPCESTVSITRRGDSSWVAYNLRFPNRARLIFNRHRLVARSRQRGPRAKVERNRSRFRPIPCRRRITCFYSCYAPVFHNGAFYYLGRDGRLGVFDLRRGWNAWRVLDTRCKVFESHRDNEAFLMSSSRGELISVVVGPSDDQLVTVLKFNDDLEQWQCLPSLGDQAAFLSYTSSVVLPCDELQVKGLENTIHFARFEEENYNMFYSLSTRKFHSFKSGCASDRVCDRELPLNCTWMVPTFRRLSHQQLNWTDDSVEEEEEDIERDIDPPPPPHLLKNFKFVTLQDGPTRTREQEAPVARPWIMLKYKESEEAHTLVDLVSNTSHPVINNTMEILRGKQVYHSSNGGVLLLVNSESGECALLNTSSMAVDSLPTLKTPKNFKRHSCLVHPPANGGNSRKTLVAIFGGVETSGGGYNVTASFCRVGDEEWTTSSTGGVRVHGVVPYRGKFYGVGELPGLELRLVEMELQGHHWEVKVIDGIELWSNEHMGETACERKMVESCGELLLFKKIMSDISETRQVIMDVRVYRIDLDATRLQVVKDLGDRAFSFYHGGTFGCCASKSGFSKGSLYFAVECEGRVYRYDYRSGRIATVFACRDEVDSCSLHGLVMCY